MVSSGSMAMMVVGIVLSLALPIVLLIYLKKKYQTSIKVFLAGCGIWIVFTLILEAIVHQMILGNPDIGPSILNNTWLYAIYGGLAAALFEESGRLVAMKFMLKNHHDNKYNSIMYGAGHGGIEAIFVLGIGMLNNMVTSNLINAGQTSVLLDSAPSEELKNAMRVTIQQLIDATPIQFVAGDLERISAFIMHIAFSVFVWIAVTKGKKMLWGMAFLMHMFVDAITVILFQSVQASSAAGIALELVILAMAVGIAFVAFKYWKANLSVENIDNSEEIKMTEAESAEESEK